MGARIIEKPNRKSHHERVMHVNHAEFERATVYSSAVKVFIRIVLPRKFCRLKQLHREGRLGKPIVLVA